MSFFIVITSVGLDELDAAILRAPVVGGIVGYGFVRSEARRGEPRRIDTEADESAEHGAGSCGGEPPVVVGAARGVGVALDREL
jgi:hypothetical protein